MALLKFLKGNYASLNSAAIAEGQVLITKDTREIFVDVDASTRIKIGDFITVANMAALPAATDVPTTRLYYVEDGNILARSNGTDWVQVNKQKTATELKEMLGLGSMAYKSEVAEGDLNADLKAKVNAAAEGNHSHSNKTVLDGITAEKVAAWDAAEGNAKSYTDGKDSAMNTRVEALETAIGEDGSVATQIKTAIEALDYTDAAVAGEYVSAVNEVDGKISVTRVALPDYSNTYDAKGAAATAESNAKAYADGLAANYDEKGAAAGVQTTLEAEIAKKVDKVEGKSLVADTEITKLTGISAGANKVEASENGKIKIDGVDTVVYTHPDKHAIDDVTGLQDALDGKQAKGDYAAEVHTHVAADVTDLDSTIKGYNYATKTEAEGYANAKDEAIAAALKAGTDAAAAAAVADGKAVAAQSDVDALETYVGTFTHDTAKSVVEYINAKTDGIATSENLEALGSRVTAVEGDVATIKGDYLKAADKTELEGKITAAENAVAAEKSRAEGIEAGLESRLAAVEGDYLTSDDKTALQNQIDLIMNNPDTENVINSISEFTQYIEDHGEIAEGFRTDIDANEQAIIDEAAAARAAEGALSGRIDTLEAIDHDAYVAADTALKNELNGAIALKADASTVSDMDTAYKAADTALSGRIEKLENNEAGYATTDDVSAAMSEALEGAANTADEKVQALANGAVATNAADISDIKNQLTWGSF